MTGIDPDALECSRRWAAEQLGLAPDASTGDVRQCWLRRLGDEAFVPSAELRWALAVMLQRRPGGGWEKRVDEIALREEQERLRGAVETFAQDFWDFEPGDRRQRWQALLAACAPVPSLQARLRLLEAGLGPVPMPAAGAPDERVLKLAHEVRRLFVLRPEPRARARQGFLSRTAGDSKNWQAAARRLRHTCPALAALGNDLLHKVGAAMPVFKAPRYAPAPTPAPENQGIRWPKFLIWACVICVVRILVGINSPSKDAPPRSSFPAPSFPRDRLPDHPWPETKDNKKNPPQEWEWDRTGAPAGEKLRKLLEDIAKEHPEWKVPPQNGQPEAEKKAKDNKSP